MKKIFKRYFLLLLIVCCFCKITSAQSITQKEQAVQKTVVKLFDALSNNDTAGIKLYITADIHFFEYGQIWTTDTIIHKMMLSSGMAGFKRTNKFDFVSTSINGNTAWTTYYLHSEITRNGKQEIVNWMETVVLVKEKKQWKINVLHSTRLIKN